MDKLIIRKQNAPTRCEICHQSDQFDPRNGVCQRCSALMKPAPAAVTELPINNGASTRAMTAAIFGIAALVPGLVLGPFALFFGITGMILGHRELNSIQRGSSQPEGKIFADFGLYIGFIACLLWMIICIVFCC